MVSFLIPTAKQSFPPNFSNCISNFLSKKHQCLFLLKLCFSFKHMSQIHAQIHVSGLHEDAFLQSELVRLCTLSAEKYLSFARSLLYRSVNTVPASWNMLIRGYMSDSTKDAMWVFVEMRRRGIRPNKLTFPFLIKACAVLSALEEGRQVHVDVVKHGLDSDVYVQNNLVNFYGSCKKIVNACHLFDEMSDRTVVSWNAVITACVENFLVDNAIEYFVKMRDCGFEPDETTMVVVLSGCSDLGNLSLGKWIHSQVIERGLVLNCQLGTALVEMYTKCGNIGYGKIVFNRMAERNVWTWSAMILGLAQHGFAHEALNLFHTMMKSSCICPNDVTFLGVLCACTHAGLVEDGYRYFHEMEYVHGIKPMMIHYGAMVDILGRAGCLREAYNFILDMPLKPDPVVWRTLLSAFSVHDVDNDGLADEVRKRLLELEPKRTGNLVIVANIYAEGGMWEKAAKVRKTMKHGRLKKMAGESCVELGGSIYRFFSGYDSRHEYDGVYQLLEGLNLHMKMASNL
ncbi:ATP-dependent zinc metalloprotease FTSH 6 chloroplastic-like [Tripterygium wilfordii]|uniref:ATP-dependent zinc metalloprotease FTSH 6 chloroplastic-like n=1 Tax=Tripterygium wilfordii TaxID=458696 RepID=A0A7J7DRR1_TRIWF|nr:pentatricopeptide repeat-containing protein At2g36730 [Tripterygium wilfordii]KAF5748991.1 ATP-dependent zinc metalloprotease FTSH 6 chloroplastic-like [Tripterygium wilfordii]